VPHSEVPNIELSDGNTVTLHVKVVGFEPGTPIEISGYATQQNGAVATFHTWETMPADADSKNGHVFDVPDVQVVPAAAGGFVATDPIMVVARAADVWLTKLDKDDEIPPGFTAAWTSDEQSYHSVRRTGW